MAELTKVFRYDTNGGAFVGENVRQGKKFLDNEKVKQDNNTYKIFDNYKFIQTEDIFDYVISEYSKFTMMDSTKTSFPSSSKTSVSSSSPAVDRTVNS